MWRRKKMTPDFVYGAERKGVNGERNRFGKKLDEERWKLGFTFD